MKPMVITLLLVAAACSNEAPPQAAVQPAPQAAPAPLAEAQRAQKAAAVVSESRPNPDLELAARVKKALDEAVSPISQGIDVAAAGGVVRLYGTVASRAERRKAERVAAALPGVTSVENKLVVVKGS